MLYPFCSPRLSLPLHIMNTFCVAPIWWCYWGGLGLSHCSTMWQPKAPSITSLHITSFTFSLFHFFICSLFHFAITLQAKWKKWWQSDSRQFHQFHHFACKVNWWTWWQSDSKVMAKWWQSNKNWWDYVSNTKDVDKINLTKIRVKNSGSYHFACKVRDLIYLTK